MSTTWFITGASRGLGRELTEQVLARGDRVAATLRTPSQLDDLAAAHGDRLWMRQLDVTDTVRMGRVHRSSARSTRRSNFPGPPGLRARSARAHAGQDCPACSARVFPLRVPTPMSQLYLNRSASTSVVKCYILSASNVPVSQNRPIAQYTLLMYDSRVIIGLLGPPTKFTTVSSSRLARPTERRALLSLGNRSDLAGQIDRGGLDRQGPTFPFGLSVFF